MPIAAHWDYYQPPAVDRARFAQVINTLACWLPAGASGQLLAAWGEQEWAAAEWLAYWQGATPWLVKRIQETKIAVPEDVAERMLSVDADIHERTRRMLRGAVELLNALQEHNIPAIPLKGAVLAPLYYDDPFRRALGDLDILVHKNDMSRATTVMRKLGYEFLKRSSKDEAYTRGERKKDVWSPNNVHPVEVQHRVLSEYTGLDYDLTQAIWKGSSVQPYWEETEFRIPNKAYMLLHVCSHAVADWVLGQGKLAQIEDVHLIIARMAAEDWEQFSAAINLRSARFIYPAITLVTRYAGISVPGMVLEKLDWFSPPRLCQWVAQVHPAELFELTSGENVRRDFDAHLARLLVHSHWDRAEILLRVAFPPRWHSRLEAYPRLVASPFWPFAYLLLNGKRVGDLVRSQFK